MATIINLPAKDLADIGNGLYLTQAGALALATPCGMKDYISNNRRNANGREYLTPKVDDTAISVQFVCMAKDINTAMSTFATKFGSGKGEIGGVQLLYKNVGSISQQGDAVVFSANFIKLASASTEEGGN